MKRKGDEIVLAENRSVKKFHDDRGGQASGLLAPIMVLEGHQGDIHAVKFHPEGQYLASSGFDRQIFLWNVYGECENIAVMTGHTGAVMDLHFSTDGGSLFTCSTDNTVALWDLQTCQRIKKLKALQSKKKPDPNDQINSAELGEGSWVAVIYDDVWYPGHSSFVNSCHPTRRGPQLVASASDDCTVKIWDPRKKGQCTTLNNTYQVTAVTFNDTSEQVITGGIDNDIKIWDVRKNGLVSRLRGHSDTVTGLSLSPDGSYLLSNAMDNTLRIWDIRPFAPHERCVKILSGHQHNFEKNLLRCAWAPDGSKVSAGSADRFVYVWDTTSRRILYKLPGHNGSVNDVHMHPREPIIMSGSSDKVIYLGELE